MQRKKLITVWDLLALPFVLIGGLFLFLGLEIGSEFTAKAVLGLKSEEK